MSIPIYKPYLPSGSLNHAHLALDSGWISSQGKYIQMATERLQELLNVKYVQLLNNGTSACHLMAKSLTDKKNIFNIIVPNNTYVASWNSMLFDFKCNLFTVDCDLNTWNYDLNLLDTAIKKHPEAAVLIVHNIGNIINVPELQKKYPNTVFVEDNCEGFLGKYNGVYSGTISYTSAVSFFANKVCASGEGGMLLTNDEDVYLYLKCVQGQGQSDKRFIHNKLGYNFRMTNIQAAILYGQLEILPEILQKKNDIFTRYRNSLKDREDILMQQNEVGTENANWMFGIRILNNKKSYEETELFFKNAEIEIRPMFFKISDHEHLVNNKFVEINDFTNAEILNKECFILPSYPELTEEEQNHILKTLNEYRKLL